MPVHFQKHGPVRIENCGRCGLEEGAVIHSQNRTYIFHRPCPQMGFYQLIARCIFLPGTITEGYQAYFCLFSVQFPEKFRETDLKANPDPQTDSVNLKKTETPLRTYYDSIQKGQQIEEIFHNRFLDAYNYYLIIGGMPECVSSWVKYKDPAKVAQIQKELIEVYENDFSKHNGKVNSGRILMVFRSIVSQLAKSNEKFMYGAVRDGARARDFEEAIEWLVSAGMLIRIYNVSKLEHPLSAFDKMEQFKLFVFDTGLLKHMAGLDNSAILLKNNYQFKGPLTENYVLQQLHGQFEVEPRYYSDKSGEIDFVIQYGTDIIPVETKGGDDKSAPSFKRYLAEKQPEYAIRFSKRGYLKNGLITNIPLYLARKTKELL